MFLNLRIKVIAIKQLNNIFFGTINGGGVGGVYVKVTNALKSITYFVDEETLFSFR